MNKFLLTKTEEKNIDKIFNIQKKSYLADALDAGIIVWQFF